jgi:23S rRNA-/tRNA-specific pseudouridylate synthase
MSRTFSISNALKNPANVATLRRHGVIYIDRGLIALNKKPGLVTQGTTNIHKKVESELFQLRMRDSDSTFRRGRYKLYWMVSLHGSFDQFTDALQRHSGCTESERRSIYSPSTRQGKTVA